MADGYSAQERVEIEARIIEGLSKGTPLAQLCREDGMPDRSTAWRWAEEDEVLAQRIAHAREDGFDALAEECLEIADDATNDFVEKKRPDGSEHTAFDAEHVQRSKLRIETRLKLLAKWDPRRYGELIKLGGDERTPFQIIINKPGDQA